ncbi:MAG: NAD-dependent epimerase/dehydratase family protein [Anaerolineae bacterium]|nr:NAD-dependent epimerase/dehydratase family protein [Anaerolineae bacterium]
MSVLVTGANGMLGRAIIARLMNYGRKVRAFDLEPFPDSRVESYVGDVRDPVALSQAAGGVSLIIHAASLIYPGLGKPQHVYDINVGGTRNVIDACLARGVKKLIYTSSMDVVFDGRPIVNGDESLPYARVFLDYYSETKADAERLVLASNTASGLQTCVLRPAAMYGPFDRHHFPVMFTRAKQKKLARMGDGKAQFNHVYVENVVEAHLQAAAALEPRSKVSGQIYFITDEPPRNFFDFLAPFLNAMGLPPLKKQVSYQSAYSAALASETFYKLAPGEKTANPAVTRHAVLSICRDFSFVSTKAARDFGYRPIVGREEAFHRTVAWFRMNWKPSA